jgi:hypothetical protein
LHRDRSNVGLKQVTSLIAPEQCIGDRLVAPEQRGESQGI